MQLFWKNLAPTSSDATKPSAAPTLVKQVEKDFGSLDNLKNEMNTKTAAVQGSGWGWLGYDKAKGRLEVVTTANQDPLLCKRLSFQIKWTKAVPFTKGMADALVSAHTPIIGIDIWEHAFYLQYKNVKPDYLKAIWDVINFEEAEQRFKVAQ